MMDWPDWCDGLESMAAASVDRPARPCAARALHAPDNSLPTYLQARLIATELLALRIPWEAVEAMVRDWNGQRPKPVPDKALRPLLRRASERAELPFGGFGCKRGKVARSRLCVGRDRCPYWLHFRQTMRHKGLDVTGFAPAAEAARLTMTARRTWAAVADIGEENHMYPGSETWATYGHVENNKKGREAKGLRKYLGNVPGERIVRALAELTATRFADVRLGQQQKALPEGYRARATSVRLLIPDQPRPVTVEQVEKALAALKAQRAATYAAAWKASERRNVPAYTSVPAHTTVPAHEVPLMQGHGLSPHTFRDGVASADEEQHGEGDALQCSRRSAIEYADLDKLPADIQAMIARDERPSGMTDECYSHLRRTHLLRHFREHRRASGSAE
jgi:hypothetical protein